MKGSRLWAYLILGAIAVCVCVVAAGYLYFTYASPEVTRLAPYVEITGTEPEGAGPVGQPVVVFAQARDAAGIRRAELWVNGEKTASQDNPNPADRLPFEISAAWIPTGPGEFLMVVKAVNTAGVIGESRPAVMHVGERSLEPDPELQGAYVVRDGDTWESIAGGLDIPVEDLRALNPDVDDLVPGSELRVPPRAEEGTGPEAGGDASPEDVEGAGPEDAADIPSVDPPRPPPPPAGEARDAAPDTGDELFGLPLPGSLLCMLRPEVCAEAIDGVPPPFPRPDGVSAGDVATGCGVDVFWYDNSENEMGFRIYRFRSRPRFRMDILELLGPSAGSGARLRYTDTMPPVGEFFYAVTAYNAGGETWSAPSPTHTSEGCRTEFVGLEPVIEALEMHVGEGFDRLYCYISLDDAPFVRVPQGASNFITLEAGAWNIAEYFSGSNKRVVFAEDDVFDLVVECMGWQGDELVNLGRFVRAHPREEWDGRLQNATSDSGGFSAVYRINEGYETIDEATGGTVWPLVDHSIPAPYNLRLADTWRTCERIGEGAFRCQDIAEPALAWDYTGSSAPRSFELLDPPEFKVYARTEGEYIPRHYHTSLYASLGSESAPLLESASCGAPTYYSVSFVLGIDPFTGETIESPPSSELMIAPPCAALEITLLPLWVYGVNDGDICTIFTDCRDDYEAYGWMQFNRRRVRWNDHCDPGLGGCLRATPSYDVLLEASEHDWAGMWLNHGDGWRLGNNVFRIPIRDGEALNLVFQFRDHDAHSGDDLWCGMPAGRRMVMAPARSAAEWLTFDQELTYDANCILRIRVRGVPGL